MFNLSFRKAERNVWYKLDNMNLLQDANIFNGLSLESLLSVLTNHAQDVQMVDHIRRLVRNNKDILKGIKLFTYRSALSFVIKSKTFNLVLM